MRDGGVSEASDFQTCRKKETGAGIRHEGGKTAKWGKRAGGNVEKERKGGGGGGRSDTGVQL